VLISVNHASLVIVFAKIESKPAFDELKFNPTIVTYLLFYGRITVSKKSADFTDFRTPIRYMQCLKLTRYAHCFNEICALVDIQCVYLVSIPEPVLYVIYMHRISEV